LVAAAAAALVVVGGAASAAPAGDSSPTGNVGDDASVSPAAGLDQGTPGYCPDKKGVTVVVDFNQLGGGIVVRCAPGPVGSGYTGLDALQDAGFSPEGTARWGMQFICRIAGEPAADQKLPIKGDPNYKEKCVDTPPAQAFWSYWYAPNGGSWTLSSQGPTSREAIAGGFEGWSFSLNHSQDSAPPPGIAPQRPRQPPHSPPPTTPPSSPPHSSPPPTHPTHGRGGGGGGQQGGGGSGGSHPTAPTQPPSTSAPTSQPSESPSSAVPSRRHQTAAAYGSTLSIAPRGTGPTTTSNPLAVGHNAQGEKVSGNLPATAQRSTTGSRRAAVLGILLLAVLAAGGYVAWRRRQTGAG
jgi:hypothetical protein